MTDKIISLRILGAAEGLSLILLVCIAMPLKYFYALPEAVTIIGWIHGLLFMVFVFLTFQFARQRRWKDTFVFNILLLSMIPFGLLIMDPKLKKL